MNIKTHLFKVAAFSASTLLLAGHVLAADGMSLSNVYIGAAVSQNRASGLDGKVDNAWANQGFGASSSTERSSTNPNLQLGYRINRNLSVEATYDRIGNLGVQSSVATPGVDTASGQWKAHGVGLHALVSQPLNDKWSVQGRVGLERWHTSLGMTSNTAGAANLNTSANNLSLVLGAGAAYAISRNVDATAELIHNNRVGDSATGRTSVNTVNMGLRYHFM
jgi:OmpA-OmpF porin, OOP family